MTMSESESQAPPQLPTIVDEAGDSPAWLPWLGVGLFCLAAMLIAARYGLASGAAPAASGAGDAAVAEPTPAAATK